MTLAIYFLKIQTTATDNSLKLLLCFLIGLPRWEFCVAKLLLLYMALFFMQVAFKTFKIHIFSNINILDSFFKRKISSLGAKISEKSQDCDNGMLVVEEFQGGCKY